MPDHPPLTLQRDSVGRLSFTHKAVSFAIDRSGGNRRLLVFRSGQVNSPVIALPVDVGLPDDAVLRKFDAVLEMVEGG